MSIPACHSEFASYIDTDIHTHARVQELSKEWGAMPKWKQMLEFDQSRAKILHRRAADAEALDKHAAVRALRTFIDDVSGERVPIAPDKFLELVREIACGDAGDRHPGFLSYKGAVARASSEDGLCE